MGVLKVKINGVWEEAVPLPLVEPPLDEVWTGQESPDPSGTYELWYDTNTEPGVLKAKRPNGAWEIASPDEVWVSPDEPTNTALELWVDTDEVRPPTMEEEVYVGPDDPDVIAPLNTVDMWYDPDDPAVTTGVPIGGTTGQALTKVDDTDGNAEWTGPYMPAAHVHAHFIQGPSSNATFTWTWSLAAGSYLCSFQCSAVGAVTGIRAVDLNMDGARVNQSKHWFNAINIHYVMSNGVTVIDIPADGDHTFLVVVGASTSMDTNDFGTVTLIPCEPGAVV